MLKEYAAFSRRLMIVSDMLIISAAFFIAYFFRNHISRINYLIFYLKFLPLILVIWIVYFQILRMYWSFRTARIPKVLLTVFETAGLGIITFGFFLYALKIKDFSRGLVFLIFIIAFLLLAIEKVSQIFFFRHIRRSMPIFSVKASEPSGMPIWVLRLIQTAA